MIVIEPNNTYREVPYASFESIGEAVNRPGEDMPFTTAPIPEGLEAGYTVFANDCGLLINMEQNRAAEILCRYGPLVGPIAITSYEESKEEDLISMIVPAAKAAFEARLKDVLASLDREATRRLERRKATEN